MITDSYTASCYIESIDGKYHMECEMITKDKEIYSDYDGDNFVDGLNEIMADMTSQMSDKPEPKPMTPEERVEYLEELVEDLRDENANLLTRIENLTTDCKCKNNEPNHHIDDAVKYFEDSVNEYLNNNKITYDDLYKWAEESSKAFNPSMLRWPFNKVYC